MSRHSDSSFGIKLAEACLADHRDQPTEVLKVVSQLTGARAAALVTFDNVKAGGTVVASFGYRSDLLDTVADPDYHQNERSYQEILKDPDRDYRCWWNTEFDFAKTRIAKRFLLPAGFAGGATVRLVANDGRYAGDLHLNTEERSYPSLAITETLMEAQGILANVCARASAAVGALPAAAAHAVMVSPDLDRVSVLNSTNSGLDGRLIPLSQALVKVSVEDGEFTRVARRWRDERGDWHLMQSSPAEDGVLVTVTPTALPFGISQREVQVLSLVVEGLTNYSISLRLQMSERTVAHTVARIFAKLHVSSRAAAASMGERLGLRLLDEQLV